MNEDEQEAMNRIVEIARETLIRADGRLSPRYGTFSMSVVSHHDLGRLMKAIVELDGIRGTKPLDGEGLFAKRDR